MKNDKFQENLSRPGIIVTKARYRAAARRLRNTSLNDDQCTFRIPRLILFRMCNVSDKSCRENQNTYFILMWF